MMLPKLQSEFNLGFNTEEVLSLGMVLLYNLVIMIYTDLSKAFEQFLLNTFIFLLILVVAYSYRSYKKKWFVFFRDWYVLIILITFYMESNKLVSLVNPNDVDDLIIKFDRFLFMGNDPTVLLESLHSPYLTEFLQIVYASFYFLPFMLCILIYVKGTKFDFHITASTIMMGFYISYIGYYISPAIGPRYTLAHLQNIPLSGVLTFEFIRNSLDAMEGFTRDCCPSGHTLIAILTVLLSYRYYRSFAHIALIWALLLVFSTVYLRYHYVLDLIAGVILAIITYRYGPTLLIRYSFTKEMQPKKLSEDEAQTSTS